jgi:membrane-associated phospholipid phosphatase
MGPGTERPAGDRARIDRSTHRPFGYGWAGRLLFGVALPSLVFGTLAVHATRDAEPRRLGWDFDLLDGAQHAGALKPLRELALSLSGFRDVVDHAAFLLLLAAALLVLVWRRRPHAVFGGVILFGLLLNPVLQEAFGRLPPESSTPEEYAFPSGLAFGVVALFGWLTIALWRSAWRWPLVVLGTAASLMIAVQAVVTGDHWPSDELAGWCLAVLSITLAYPLYRRLSRHDRPRPEPGAER